MAGGYGVSRKVAVVVISILAASWLMVDAVPRRTMATINCDEMINSIAPCLKYLRGDGSLPKECCDGVDHVNSMATTKTDRQQTCKCIVDTMASVSGLLDSFII
uniref:Bifunctional inhibitor/plant lipid transfer protein/seed storage helical domain-containing protein n=1 Tax=Nelumbo nucifera TaxID=4432 RepID=A0A822ZAT6_NELNU|nr:TPA_asm: hypothetical protein HUJ06_012950 [Nelumbo nucifera]